MLDVVHDLEVDLADGARIGGEQDADRPQEPDVEGDDHERHQLAAPELVGDEVVRLALALQPLVLEALGREPLADRRAHDERHDVLAAPRRRRVAVGSDMAVVAVDMLDGKARVPGEGEEPAPDEPIERLVHAMHQLVGDVHARGAVVHAEADPGPVPEEAGAHRQRGRARRIGIDPHGPRECVHPRNARRRGDVDRDQRREDEQRQRQVEHKLHVPDGRHRLLRAGVAEQLVDETDEHEGQGHAGPGPQAPERERVDARQDEEVHERIAHRIGGAGREQIARGGSRRAACEFGHWSLLEPTWLRERIFRTCPRPQQGRLAPPGLPIDRGRQEQIENK